MSDRTKKPKPFRYPREVDADELDALEADSRRWRTVERALEDGIDIALHMDSHGGVEVTYDGDHLSGPTLAAADQLAERMDKEAT